MHCQDENGGHVSQDHIKHANSFYSVQKTKNKQTKNSKSPTNQTKKEPSIDLKSISMKICSHCFKY